jgi:hypothetical protein
VSGPRPTDGGLALIPLLQRAGRDIESTIHGRSMGSTLPPGTRILIRCREDGAYPTGAVVAFVATRGLVGHRVVGRRLDPPGAATLLTRGDGTLICDPPLEAARVLGEVTNWHDGETWRPVPAAPARSAMPRLGAAGLLLLVRLALAVDRELATRLTRILAALAQRLSPPTPAPLPAGSPGDQSE